MHGYSWEMLLNSKRRKGYGEKEVDESSWAERTEIERDHDRIVFSAPIRRLANKTQVFPMDENDSVRTRLTHSNEVSNLARGAGISLCCKGFFKSEEKDVVKLLRDVPAVLATIGLVHDLGNPPFGHQGEAAIKDWFNNHFAKNYKFNDEKENEKPFFSQKFKDFLNFDGNAQTFRLVTRLHAADGEYGMDLTYATLAAMIKYPSFNSDQKSVYNKAGVFFSEKDIADDVWKKTGLKENVRHPLTYIMEVCDDIAYATIDVEDTIKKGYASYNDLKNWLEEKNLVQENGLFSETFKKIDDKINSFKESSVTDLTSDTIREVSIEIFRSIVINGFLSEASTKFTSDFLNNEMAEEDGYYEISKVFRYKEELKELKNFTRSYGFNNKEVLRLELLGRNYIYSLMDFLWEGTKNLDDKLCGANHYEKYIISLISKNYLREFKRAFKQHDGEAGSKEEQERYARYQLITDFVSGMTESYLKRVYEEIKPLYEQNFSSKTK